MIQDMLCRLGLHDYGPLRVIYPKMYMHGRYCRNYKCRHLKLEDKFGRNIWKGKK